MLYNTEQYLRIFRPTIWCSCSFFFQACAIELYFLQLEAVIHLTDTQSERVCVCHIGNTHCLNVKVVSV